MRIQFILDDQEAEFFEEYAKRKGLKPHALAKMALFQYAERFPKKGLELPAKPIQEKNPSFN